MFLKKTFLPVLLVQEKQILTCLSKSEDGEKETKKNEKIFKERLRKINVDKVNRNSTSKFVNQIHNVFGQLHCCIFSIKCSEIRTEI